MCVIKTKTYVLPNGDREIVETSKPCRRAVGSHLCQNIERKTSRPKHVVGRRPTSTPNASDPIISTIGRDGRERSYRDVTGRLGRRTSTRRSNMDSNRSSRDTPPSAMRTTPVEARPRAPSPPELVPGLGTPTRTVRQDGTAVYERPPPIDLPRAAENERRTPQRESFRRSSMSSTTAEIHEPVQPIPSRRPSIRVDTSFRPSTPTTPSISSPGLSQLPSLGRHDSGYAVPRHRQRDSEPSWQAAEEAEMERHREARRNAELNAAHAARRERHIRETAAALEGSSSRAEPHYATGYERLSRERGPTYAYERKSYEAAPYPDDRYFEDLSRPYYTTTRTSPLSARRTSGGAYPSYTYSPTSIRSPRRHVETHQDSTPRRSNPLREWGEAIIYREQMRGVRSSDGARRASQRLSDVFGRMSLGEEPVIDGAYDAVDVEYYVDAGLQRRESRLERREAEREARRREFYI